MKRMRVWGQGNQSRGLESAGERVAALVWLLQKTEVNQPPGRPTDGIGTFFKQVSDLTNAEVRCAGHDTPHPHFCQV